CLLQVGEMGGSGMAIKKWRVCPVQVQVVDGPATAVLVNPGEPTFGDSNLSDTVAIWLRQAADQSGVGQSPCPAGPAAAIS
ncbi:MAG: hypothetical protein KDA52_14770, partial [Planctomycetaceae bacterium]|nr:hypothetical protein [Planctomycetaceae bacterium]